MVSSLPLWIRSHHVWNERAGRFEARALRIEGDRITAVAAHSEVPDGAALRDFGDAYVMPGLLNTHVHLDFSGSQTPLKDFESEDPAERLLRAAGNAHRLLMSGCTTARDCGSHWTTLALARRPDLSPVPLPRLLLSGPPITVPRGHLHFMHGVVRDDGDIVAHIDRLQREGGLARFDSLEHCAFFERLPNGLINRNYDEQVALVVRDSGVAMMANLSTAMPSLDRLRTLPERSDVQDNALRQFDKMIDNFGKLVRLGVPMVCGNDAGVNETSFDSTWYEVAWMIKAGQSPVEALRSATIGAARALLIDNHVGRLEKDYSADIIALAGDPLDDAAHLQAPGFVMARGEIHVDAPAGRPA
jgi:imidazolonepropionase-like amidohydrolase